MRKNIIIPIILIVISLLMLTVFAESLHQIDDEAFMFLSALILGIGIGMLLKVFLPKKKRTQ